MSESSDHNADVLRVDHDTDHDLCVRVQAARILHALVDAGHLETDERTFTGSRGGRRSARMLRGLYAAPLYRTARCRVV